MNINYIDFSNTTRFHDDGDVPYITFRKFDGLDFIKHGFSTRLGGVSKGIYESMDLTFTRGDDPDAVRENFRLIGRALDIRPEDIYGLCNADAHNQRNRSHQIGVRNGCY